MGALFPFLETDPLVAAFQAAFVNGLRVRGWREGENLRLEARHAVGEAQLRQRAVELAALRPTVILVSSNAALAAVRHQIAVPIVFVAVSDPVGSGFVESLARPGGNITGLANFAPEMGAKWMQMLREVAPRVQRVMLLLNPAIAANRQLADSAAQAAAAAGVETVRIDSGAGAALESAFADFAGKRSGGVIVFPNPANLQNHEQIVDAARRYKLPAIYPFPFNAKNGGLVAYGVDLTEQYRLSADYVDRILRGANPAQLPVQQPDKYELIINLRVARQLELTIPGALLAHAAQVIE